MEKESTVACKWINNFLPHSKISIAYNTQNKISVDLHSHLVYEYIYGRCPKRYIGESVRLFTTRKHEHTSGQPEKTEITLRSSIHPIKEENFKTKFRTRYTKTAEAMYIKSMPSSNLLNDNRQQIPILVF